MIDLYYAPTPNGLKLRLFLEEVQLAHRIVPVSLSKGEQLTPEFLAISPNNKIPALVDHAPADGGAPVALFESGAMLVYLSEKSGELMPAEPRARLAVLQWLFWQVGGLGPMAGQIGHFNVHAPEKVPYAIERYTKETDRLYGVLDRRLADHAFIADDYSIADIACYPWIVPHQAHGQDLGRFPHLRRWFETIAARPATARVYADVADTYGAGAFGVRAEGPVRSVELVRIVRSQPLIEGTGSIRRLFATGAQAIRTGQHGLSRRSLNPQTPQPCDRLGTGRRALALSQGDLRHPRTRPRCPRITPSRHVTVRDHLISARSRRATRPARPAR